MGKSKGGGGGGQAPQADIPQGLFDTASATTGLGQYATSLLNPLASMTNWAAGLATGGNAQPIPSVQSVSTQAGPGILFNGKGTEWNSSFDPQTGLITFSNPKNPRQTFVSTLDQAKGEGADIPQGVLNNWEQSRTAYVANQGGASGGITNYTWESLGQQLGLSQADIGNLINQGYTPDQAAVKYGLSTGTAPSGGWNWASLGQAAGLSQANLQLYESSGMSPDEAAMKLGLPAESLQNRLGPFLGQAWGDIQQEQAATGDLKSMEDQTKAFTQEVTQEGQKLMQEGQTMLTEATTGTGLYPSQQAAIDLAKKTEEQQVESVLGSMGLGKSTQIAQLKGEADLAAEGQAGLLVQGNISAAQQQIALGQASQKLALGGQTLETGEQAALVQELTDISNQSVAFQRNLWDEAMAGYGVMGGMIDEAAKGYGLSLQAYQDMLQAQVQNAQIQEGQIEAQQKADAQSSAGLFGALGQLLGGSGGGGGSSGGGGGSSASGIGSIIGAVVGVIGSIFCWVAREVWGIDNPKWAQFALWLYHDSPVWFRRWYMNNGEAFARWIHERPVAKFFVKIVMEMILYAECRWISN